MNVKLARIKLGITQSELCKRIKMSPKKLCEIEKGNTDSITLGQMKKLSNELNVSIQELFF